MNDAPTLQVKENIKPLIDYIAELLRGQSVPVDAVEACIALVERDDFRSLGTAVAHHICRARRLELQAHKATLIAMANARFLDLGGEIH